MQFTSNLPHLTSAQVVLRCEPHAAQAQQQPSARAQAAQLPHVALATSSFLDHGVPKFWSLPRASTRNLLSLLPRLACYEPADMDPHYRAFNCSKALVAAVENDNLAMAEWLHAYCPSVHPHKAIVQAMRHENKRLMKCLVQHNACAFKLQEEAGAIVSTGDVEVLRWLPENSHSDAINSAFTSAVLGGHLDSVKYLHERYAGMAPHLDGVIFAACKGGHLEIAQFLKDQGYKLDVVASLTQASRSGNLEIVQWLFSMASEPSALQRRTEMDVAAENEHLELLQWPDANDSNGCRDECCSPSWTP